MHWRALFIRMQGWWSLLGFRQKAFQWAALFVYSLRDNSPVFFSRPRYFLSLVLLSVCKACKLTLVAVRSAIADLLYFKYYNTTSDDRLLNRQYS